MSAFMEALALILIINIILLSTILAATKNYWLLFTKTAKDDDFHDPAIDTGFN